MNHDSHDSLDALRIDVGDLDFIEDWEQFGIPPLSETLAMDPAKPISVEKTEEYQLIKTLQEYTEKQTTPLQIELNEMKKDFATQKNHFENVMRHYQQKENEYQFLIAQKKDQEKEHLYQIQNLRLQLEQYKGSWNEALQAKQEAAQIQKLNQQLQQENQVLKTQISDHTKKLGLLLKQNETLRVELEQLKRKVSENPEREFAAAMSELKLKAQELNIQLDNERKEKHMLLECLNQKESRSAPILPAISSAAESLKEAEARIALLQHRLKSYENNVVTSNHLPSHLTETTSTLSITGRVLPMHNQ